MASRHLAFWPADMTHHLDLPATNLVFNAEVSARRYPDKPSLIYYDTPVSFRDLLEQAERVAGFLQQRCGVVKGERVALFMQNSPQFVIGYYGILRADAVVVPLNPMCLTEEVKRCLEDAGARRAIVAQELFERVEPLLSDGTLEAVVVATYSDYLERPTCLNVPAFVAAPFRTFGGAGVAAWREVLELGLVPQPMTSGPDDLAVMPYTSGTTGEPKGCMHTHRSIMHTAVGGTRWFALQPELTLLAVAPLFHVTGMQGAMNGPIYNGNTVVLLPRWDRDVVAECVERYRVASWTGVPTMVQDFFANPALERYDLSSIRRLSGGGAAMPAAVAERLAARGITYCEGYGLSETAAATHINPPERAKPQCLGIPIYDVDSRVVDPGTLEEREPGETGEIITHGPQVCLGYWNKPLDTDRAFVEIDGKRFLRTGDLARTDEDGYFFMVDRIKRMINASGYKVWPSEVETFLYRHSAVLEACVIGTFDAHRGQTVKALIVLKPEARGELTEAQMIEWCRERMAAYKIPRVVEFVSALPKSGSGKIQWRALQEQEDAGCKARAAVP